MIVAIDGPSGSGKSTTARRVAEVLGYFHLDTGLMYRAVAYTVLSNSTSGSVVDTSDFSGLCATYENGALRLLLEQEDIVPFLRTPEVASMASRVATFESVRKVLRLLQQSVGARYGSDPGLVAEGRDMGTVVFPEAPVKIFMTASLRIRAQRRRTQLLQKGVSADIEDLRRSMEQRDRKDEERAHSPLRPASDAIFLNTDHYTISGQVARVVSLVRERQQQGMV